MKQDALTPPEKDRQVIRSKEVAEETANQSGQEVGLVHTVLNVFFDVVESKLTTHSQVELHEGFGSLVTRDAGGKSEKHPARVPTPKHRVVSFKATSALKKRLRKK